MIAPSTSQESRRYDYPANPAGDAQLHHAQGHDLIALGLFATGVAASMLLILAHDRPFTGEISIKPDPLLQVMPEIAS
jgi:hypothetical protein